MSHSRANNILPRGKEIANRDFQVLQWVKFSLEKSRYNPSEEQKKIYQADRFFLVVSRTDEMYDSCRCYLIDATGKTYDYCPRMGSLGDVNLLWDQTITAFS